VLLYLPVGPFQGYSLLFDLNLRLSVNDSYVGTYYVWWTNLLYLPWFFFLTVSTVFFITTRWSLTSLALGGLTLFWLYPLELCDYLLANTNLEISNYGFYGLNTLLTNVLNRYHPLIFYISVAFLFLALLNPLIALDTLSNTNRHSSLRSSHLFSWIAIAVNLVALWMGSWWALQEGTWGGWWNWDSSEMFGLTVTLIGVSLVHSLLTLNTWEQSRIKTIILLCFFIVTYFFIQLNFELVSHNFGSKFFFFFNNNLFFLEASGFLLGVIFFKILQLIQSHYTQSVYCKRRGDAAQEVSWTLWSLVPSLVFSLWITLSYQPLANYFLWNFADLNLFNYEPSWQPLHLLFALFNLIWVWRVKKEDLLSVVLLPGMVSGWAVPYLTHLRFTTSLTIVHLSLLIILWINITVNGTDLSRWEVTTDYCYDAICRGSFLSISETSILDNVSLEMAQITWTPATTVDVGWNLASSTNVPSLNFFSLLTSHTTFANSYKLTDNYINAYLYLEIPLVPALNGLFFTALLTTTYHVFFRRR